MLKCLKAALFYNGQQEAALLIAKTGAKNKPCCSFDLISNLSKRFKSYCIQLSQIQVFVQTLSLRLHNFSQPVGDFPVAMSIF